MNRGVLSAAALAVLLCGVPAAVPACAQDEGSSPLADQPVPGAPALPGLPPAPFPDFGRSWPFFPPGQNTIKPRPRGQLPGGLAPGARRPNLEQGDAAAARAEALKKALVPKPSPEAVRKEMLDKLFERLRSAAEPEEAQRIAQSIQRLWLRPRLSSSRLPSSFSTSSSRSNLSGPRPGISAPWQSSCRGTEMQRWPTSTGPSNSSRATSARSRGWA